jgi:hypothetical protein
MALLLPSMPVVELQVQLHLLALAVLVGWLYNALAVRAIARRGGAGILNILNLAGDDDHSIQKNAAADVAATSTSVIAVPSVLALRKLALPSSPLALAVTPGYRPAGGSGGGTFALDFTDTTSADDGGSTIVGPAGVRWKRVLQSAEGSSLSVCDFGAVGDGVTNDTLSFQRCIAWATARAALHGGCTIRVPAGVYLLSSTLTLSASSGLALVGEGRSHVRLIRRADYGDTIVIAGDDKTVTHHVSVSGLSFFHDFEVGVKLKPFSHRPAYFISDSPQQQKNQGGMRLITKMTLLSTSSRPARPCTPRTSQPPRSPAWSCTTSSSRTAAPAPLDADGAAIWHCYSVFL